MDRKQIDAEIDRLPFATTHDIHALRWLNQAKDEVTELLAKMTDADIEPTDPIFGAVAQLENHLVACRREVARAMPNDGTGIHNAD